jgi:hypothetical protein
MDDNQGEDQNSAGRTARALERMAQGRGAFGCGAVSRHRGVVPALDQARCTVTFGGWAEGRALRPPAYLTVTYGYADSTLAT